MPANGGPDRDQPRGARREVGQTQEKNVSVSQDYRRPATCSARTPCSVTLSNPYTFRATALANVTGLLAAIALFALGLSVLVSAAMARRFTTPLRRLTEASRGLAEGDLSRRVPPDEVRSGSSEMAELAVQFNAMADRLQESVEIIRRDRDRSRDFLADVSHELRTPLAALRTFNELLKEGAADDPEARAEFLESSGQQIERLDWLAQNLLELSKLDSGLVLLDLRPGRPAGGGRDGRRAEHGRRPASRHRPHAAPARRAGPDPPRPAADRPGRGQPRRQRGQVHAARRVGLGRRGARRRTGRGSRSSTPGVGIDATELPHIFERFYRGSRANEARGSGSGLGLAIVRSIVDMHGGTVEVESRVGTGSRFTVTLPRDPRLVEGTPAAERAAVASAADARTRPGAAGSGAAPLEPQALIGNMQETSPSDPPKVNPEPAP